MSAALTPLLDTLFLLLFALLALSETRSARTHDVHLRLPEVEPGPDVERPEDPRVVLEIDADSTVRMLREDGAGAPGEPSAAIPLASRAELDAALAGALADEIPEEIVVEIRADRDARHGTAVQLLQHLRVAGFVNVRLLASGAPDASDWLAEEHP